VWGVRIRVAAVSGAVTSVLLFCGSPAFAQVRQFDIPAEDAGKSVPELARQAGIQVIAPGDQLHGIVTPAIKGTYDVTAALNLMLKGTGLTVSRTADGVLMISPRETIRREEQGDMSQGLKNSTSALALVLTVLAGAPAHAQDADTVETVTVTGYRMKEDIQKVSASISALAIADAILEDVARFQGAKDRFDDETIIVLRVR